MPRELGWQNTRDNFAVPVAQHRSFRCGDFLIDPGDHRNCSVANPSLRDNFTVAGL
jgi:hypothetical protein